MHRIAMLKFWLATFCFSCFGLSISFAQNCNFPLPPANTCANAPLLCDLDGYCSDNSGATNSGTPNAFCGVVENNNWISFIAGSTSLEIEVSVFGCNQGNGLQVHVFETDDCNFFISKSNCLDPVPNNGTGVMLATNLVIGQVYYLMMDGKGGDVCDYSYALLDGITLSPAEVVIDPPGYLCEGQTLTLEATTWSSNPGLIQEWSTLDGNILSGENSTMALIDMPGTYQLYIEDASGCTDSTFVMVEEAPLPIAEAGTADTLNCLNNTMIMLDGSHSFGFNALNYQWATSSGNIVSGANTPTPTINEPGAYFLTVSDQVTQCAAVDTVVVFIDANTPFAKTGGGGELNCVTPQIELNGIGSSFGNNFTYQWTTSGGNITSGAQTLFPVVDAPGLYQLEVLNTINGCIAADQVLVTLNEEKPYGAEVAAFAPCFEMINGRIVIDTVFGGTPPFLYSFGDTILSYTNRAEYLPSGQYRVTIKDAIGCEWDTLVTVGSEVQLIADLGEDFYLPLGCEYELVPLINIDESQVAGWNWIPEDLFSCDSCFNQLIRPLENTQTFHFTYTDVNGCRASDAITIYLDRTRNVFIPNVFSPNGDGVNDIFYINAGKDVALIRSFTVYDRWGSMVHETREFAPNDPAFGWDGKLGRKNLNESVFAYVVEVEFLDGWFQQYTGSVILVR
ncbi:MAG: gliding motility-associated C-terminal domain-containing protein [Saprospiraceae bacterium]|nr:gliding motility-associated C-terminal domain-containing protein [Saprospiraceae bacterium]MCB9326635.1 gliding motility-associated C-terminal domain-containing protein [Lewinellaceae bacterium]